MASGKPALGLTSPYLILGLGLGKPLFFCSLSVFGLFTLTLVRRTNGGRRVG